MTPPPPRSTLFPYTTLFRSDGSSRIELADKIFPAMANEIAGGQEIVQRFHEAWRRSAEIFRSEEHTSELQSRPHLVCRLLLEKKKTKIILNIYTISNTIKKD